MQHVAEVGNVRKWLGRGHQHLVTPPHREQGEQPSAASGIEFTEHVVEKDDRRHPRLVLQVANLGELAREHDAALLSL